VESPLELTQSTQDHLATHLDACVAAVANLPCAQASYLVTHLAAHQARVLNQAHACVPQASTVESVFDSTADTAIVTRTTDTADSTAVDIKVLEGTMESPLELTQSTQDHLARSDGPFQMARLGNSAGAATSAAVPPAAATTAVPAVATPTLSTANAPAASPTPTPAPAPAKPSAALTAKAKPPAMSAVPESSAPETSAQTTAYNTSFTWKQPAVPLPIGSMVVEECAGRWVSSLSAPSPPPLVVNCAVIAFVVS
jgi:hypothetical protein